MLGFYPSISSHPFLPSLAAGVLPLELSSCGYVPENPCFDGELSANEYFSLLSKTKNLPINAKLQLQKAGLYIEPWVKIKTYSKGMKQRLSLALALASNPKTLVLDEPTSGLDIFGKEEALERIVELNKEVRLILSTHSLQLAYALKNEIWILKEGSIFYKGRPSEFEELRELFLKARPKRL